MIEPGLWLGDLDDALETETLKANRIKSVLSIMSGRVVQDIDPVC